MTAWLVGIDDTDTLDSPGTNKLALYLAEALAGQLDVRLIVRHQLLFDPRVPYTSHNGCVSLRIETELDRAALRALLARRIARWCPDGSDPGLCLAALDADPEAIVAFGLRCQRELVTQDDARRVAAGCGATLECLGGTGDGVIGALAAVGLLATRNDGRILHAGCTNPRWSDITGWQTLEDLARVGVSEVCRADTSRPVTSGRVLLPKRLRPNLRAGRAVLFVEPATAIDGEAWQAVKIV